MSPSAARAFRSCRPSVVSHSGAVNRSCLPARSPRRLDGAVDNSELDDDELVELPREEALVRLLELRNRYGLSWSRATGPLTGSEQHRVEHGHPLRFGCCAPSPARVP